MQLSGASRGAVRLAAERAIAGGSELIGCADLLAGLAAVEGGGARHALGPAADRLRAPLPAAATARTAAFDAEARAAIEAGSRRATAAQRAHLASTDLLDAVLASASGAAALRSAGGDPDAVRAALDHDACCPETAPTYTAAALADLVDGAAALPRRAWIAGFAGQLAVTALLYALVLAIAWDTAGPELILSGAAGAVLIALAVAAVRAPATRRRMAAREAREVPLPLGADRLLGRLALRSLEVRVHPGVGGDRCYRRLGRAWISISAHTDHDEQRARFVMWHEAAHLARRDSRARITSGVLGLGLLAGALLSFDPRAMAAAGAGLPLVTTLARWWSEAACDRLAVRRAGPAAMRAWAAEHRRTAAALRARGLLPLRRRYRSRLTHPPMALRTALHARR